MSVEKEKGDVELGKTVMGSVSFGHGAFQSSLGFPNTWRGHRRETDSGN